MMKNIVSLLIALPLSFPLHSHESPDTLLAVFWNLENFFDHIDGGAGESDTEWSSFGSRRWTKRRFHAKCSAVAKSVFWISGKYGRMPDIIGLAEIENRRVLVRLLGDTLLRKYGYGIIHYDSSDRRGIDVALLYRKSLFKENSISLEVPSYEGKELNTRDILQVCLENDDGLEINFIVNHHPSKYGGTEASRGRRTAAMQALRSMCDSLVLVQPHVPIVAMGDFNDTPDGEQFHILDGRLVNMADSLFKAGEGTIRYEGKWDLIDMFLVSPSVSSSAAMEICRIPFLMVWERKHPGFRPLRTYSGPRYMGGVSDHCPVVLRLFFKK